MYSINLEAFEKKTGINLKAGDEVLYKRFSLKGIYYQPEVLVIIEDERCNALPYKEKDKDPYTYGYGSIIQCVDADEIEISSKEKFPEYYI